MSCAIDYDEAAFEAAYTRAVRAFEVPPPMSLDAWARSNFYLSKESSYVEGAWDPWPFQRGIMACISHDQIEEINWQKAARTGNTKIMLAAIGYFAQHKKRNQAIWQPSDDDRDQFVKTELDPFLRDVPVMRGVLPKYLSRSKDNTIKQKLFLGSTLHMLGGKAGKNFRRISVDVGYIDEVDAFDQDIEKEGDAPTLAGKRVEGATFPKLIIGSTPKLAGFSQIEARIALADVRFQYVVPCRHCGEFHPITWGGKDADHGFKWRDRDPSTVAHLCRGCGGLMTQGDYLHQAAAGFYRSDDGVVRLDVEGDQARFTYTADGSVAPVPRHIGFVGVWTAYSPAAEWPKIVKDYLFAYERSGAGDLSKLKAFTNTTLGRTWEAEIERTDADDLRARAEPYSLGRVPRGGLVLLCGVDTQDNRLEAVVWAIGRGGEMWAIDYQVFWGNPAQAEVWADLDDYLFQPFAHEAGQSIHIKAVAIDSRGHNTHAVYDYCARHKGKPIYPIAGRGGTAREKKINDGHSKVDIDYRGRLRKQGVILWQVGTNLAKDLLYSRLQIARPGPGYVHFSDALSGEFFAQMAGEVRAEDYGPRGRVSKWIAQRKRVECWDCSVYVIWLEDKLELSRKSVRWWDDLEARVCPPIADMFADEPPPSPSGPNEKPRAKSRRAPLKMRIGR